MPEDEMQHTVTNPPPAETGQIPTLPRTDAPGEVRVDVGQSTPLTEDPDDEETSQRDALAGAVSERAQGSRSGE